MEETGRSKRQLEDLSAHELSRIRTLNAQLSEAEVWVRQRARQCLAAYYEAGGRKRYRFSESLREDVEVDAKITCLLREDHPDFKVDDDNILAELDASIPLIEGREEDFRLTNWNELHAGDDHPLTDVHFCHLFHDLFDHKFHADWDRILAVGGLWIDVTLIQQRMVSWS